MRLSGRVESRPDAERRGRSRLGPPSASTEVPARVQGASKQDKYTLKIPNGLAFAEFRGYENWPVIAISHNGNALAAILGNTEMINAYKAGIPGNGKPFPNGAKMGEGPLECESECR